LFSRFFKRISRESLENFKTPTRSEEDGDDALAALADPPPRSAAARRYRLSPRPATQVVRFTPAMSASCRSSGYPFFAKLSLLRYKVWHGDPQRLWPAGCSDSDLVSAWLEFLETDSVDASAVPRRAKMVKQAEAWMANDIQNVLEEMDAPVDDEFALSMPVSPNQPGVAELVHPNPVLGRDGNANPEGNPGDGGFLPEDAVNDSDDPLLFRGNINPAQWVRPYTAEMLVQLSKFWNSEARLAEENKLQPAIGSPHRVLADFSLNPGQQRAFDMIVRSAAVPGAQLLAQVEGTAGTGKSYLIKALTMAFGDRLMITATTGLAAESIGGTTVHSALKLHLGSKSKMVSADSVTALQAAWRGKTHLSIDEKSMLGKKTFAVIDAHCKLVTGHMSRPFGGLSVILCGDWGQLPAVKDTVLYSGVPTYLARNLRSATDVVVLETYRMFNNVAYLTECKRQEGEEDVQRQFRSLLLRLRRAECTRADYDLLSTRFVRDPLLLKRQPWSDAVRVFTTNERADSYNFEKIRQLGEPIARIDAKNSTKEAHARSAQSMGNVDNILFVCQGAKVMLTRNLWKEAGLMNGSIGTVFDICYAPGTGPGRDVQPVCFLVYFERYRGTSVISDTRCIVPIVPVNGECLEKGRALVRKGFPLRLAYALTVHKSQGQTLQHAVIDIGDKEFSPGLSFVAISCVPRLDRLLLMPFEGQRLLRMGSGRGSSGWVDRRKEDERLRALGASSAAPKLLFARAKEHVVNAIDVVAANSAAERR